MEGYPTHVCLLLPSEPLSPSCPPFPPQEYSILLSIKSLGRTLRGAVAGGRRGALEKAAWTVAVRTEAVMRRHCRTPHQVCVPSTAGPCAPHGLRAGAHLGPTGRGRGLGMSRRGGRGGVEHSLTACPQKQSRLPRTHPTRSLSSRRRLLLRALDTVATCWEKLFALRATATGKS